VANGAFQPKVLDEKEVLLSTTIGRRCRIHCAETRQMAYGWIDQISESDIRLNLLPGSPVPVFSPEVPLLLEIAGPRSLLMFKGLWVRGSGEFQYMRVNGLLDERILDNASRIRVHGISGVLKHGGQEVQMEVIDMSENGIGFSTNESIEVGSECEIVIQSVAGPVNLLASIRHIRGIEGSESFVAGATVRSEDRLGKARWVRLRTDIAG
jgi:hypothetical protein